MIYNQDIEQLSKILSQRCPFRQPYLFKGKETKELDGKEIVTADTSRLVETDKAWFYRILDLLYNYTNNGHQTINKVYYPYRYIHEKPKSSDYLEARALYEFMMSSSKKRTERKLFSRTQLLYRGVLATRDYNDEVRNYKAGDTFIFPSFTSTSVYEQTASNFHQFYSDEVEDEMINVLFILTVFRNTPRLDFSKDETIGSEAEVILPPGSRFQVTTAERETDLEYDSSERVLEIRATYLDHVPVYRSSQSVESAFCALDAEGDVKKLKKEIVSS